VILDEPKWKLFAKWCDISNGAVREIEMLWHSDRSLDEAVRDAGRLPPNATAIRIEGPNGERFDSMEIMKLCTEQRRRTLR
jgi:hypothetical protein